MHIQFDTGRYVMIGERWYCRKCGKTCAVIYSGMWDTPRGSPVCFCQEHYRTTERENDDG